MTAQVKNDDPETISWEEFCKCEEVRPGLGLPLAPIYRGQADWRWPLVSPIVRSTFDQIRQFGTYGVAGISKLKFQGQIKHFKYLATGLPNIDVPKLCSGSVRRIEGCPCGK